jgi:phosphatidylserine/phosphatidylglycerophosphate/cardiolipin synthase-like enzyme
VAGGGRRGLARETQPGGGSNGVPVDYMHAKVVVADDAVFTGSFNLSRSGEENAENMLEIEDAGLATRLATWIDELRDAHPAADLA